MMLSIEPRATRWSWKNCIYHDKHAQTLAAGALEVLEIIMDDESWIAGKSLGKFFVLEDQETDSYVYTVSSKDVLSANLWVSDILDNLENLNWKNVYTEHGNITRSAAWYTDNHCSCPYRYGQQTYEANVFTDWMRKLSAGISKSLTSMLFRTVVTLIGMLVGTKQYRGMQTMRTRSNIRVETLLLFQSHGEPRERLESKNITNCPKTR